MSRRIDAALNDERIVAAARRVLAEQPNAGMDQLASAAGVGRATLYRRFSTREELMSELLSEARREARHAVKSARIDEGTAPEALGRLIVAIIEVADRFAFLNTGKAHEHGKPKDAKPWVDLVKRGQAAGEFSDDLPATWWVAVIGAHLREAAAAVAEGGDASELASTTTRAILHGLGGRGPSRGGVPRAGSRPAA